MYLDFIDARNIVRKQNLKNQKEWSSWIKGKSQILSIPSNPHKVYSEWISLSDWLGSKNVQPNKMQFYTYDVCKDIVIGLNFKNRSEFYKYVKNCTDCRIPRRPDHVYKQCWNGWHIFLNNSVPPIHLSKKFLNFQKAKEFLKEKGLRNYHDYVNFVKSNDIDFLPLRPDYFYKDNWDGYKNYLSFKGVKTSYGEDIIKAFLQRNSIEFIREKKFDTCRNFKELPFDFFLPKYNICIEYDGELHYRASKMFGGIPTLNRILHNDSIKSNWCVLNSIKLIRISFKNKGKIDRILSTLIV